MDTKNAVSTTLPKIINKRLKTFHSLSENEQKNNYFEKKVFYRDVSMNTLNAVWANPLKNLWQKKKDFHPLFGNDSKKYIRSSEKTVRLKGFLWVPRIQFWPPRQEMCDRKRTFFRSISDIDKKRPFWNFFFQKCFYGQVECFLKMPPKTYHQKTEKFLLNIGKRNLTFPEKLFLLKMFTWKRRKQS